MLAAPWLPLGLSACWPPDDTCPVQGEGLPDRQPRSPRNGVEVRLYTLA